MGRLAKLVPVKCDAGWARYPPNLHSNSVASTDRRAKPV